METFELRYFYAVARHENVNQAARELTVSPGSLSKAVARLEDELGVKLFERINRTIRLTPQGRSLQKRAAQILSLEEATKAEMRGHEAQFQVRLAGPEALLAKVAPQLVARIRHDHSHASFTFASHSDTDTIRQVEKGDAHFGLITSPAPLSLCSKALFHTHFRAYVGCGHPLHEDAKTGKPVPIQDLLLHPFVASDQPILGHAPASPSADGWRDDVFPRIIAYVTHSLSLLEMLLVSGAAVACLPDYFVESMPVVALTINDGPSLCQQTISLIAKRPHDIGWLNRLF